jgi:hypothetical protein
MCNLMMCVVTSVTKILISFIQSSVNVRILVNVSFSSEVSGCHGGVGVSCGPLG